MKLQIVPIFQAEAFAFVEQFHRHHKKPVGCIFVAAVWDGVTVNKVLEQEFHLNGVAVVGRPHDRHQQDGFTACVTRLCTDGTPNACSMLYAASWRIAKELGYRRLITYILNTEPGTSLKAAGWKCLGERRGGSWNVPSRPRVDKHPTQKKILFEAVLKKPNQQLKLKGMSTAFVDYGVTPEHDCKFNGACYGEICICNELCLKKESELTEEEKKYIEKFNEEIK